MRALGLIAALLLMAGCDREAPLDPADATIVVPNSAVDDDRPRLALLTSLPLIFPEDGFSLDSAGSSALAALERDYSVDVIAAADTQSLAHHDLLVMAHAPAQTAEGLVELDAWIEQGGRVLLLADPRLLWQSSLPLGDRRRPLISFPDTGLLGHWGLRLDAPVGAGPVLIDDGDRRVLLGAPGRLVATGEECRVENDGLIAQCRIGEGRAIIIADADFIMVDEGGLDGPTDGNLPFLIEQLARL